MVDPTANHPIHQAFGDIPVLGLYHTCTFAQVTLPGSLERLTLADSDFGPLDTLSLPCGLKDLTLGGGFNQNLQRLQLPTALQRCRMAFCTPEVE